MMSLDLDEVHREHSASFQRLCQNWFRQSSHMFFSMWFSGYNACRSKRRRKRLI